MPRTAPRPIPNDALAAVVGGVTRSGGAGADSMSGTDGHDTLFGNGGNDFLNGGGGKDHLVGGAGADTLFGGVHDGADTLAGGEGNDTFVWMAVGAEGDVVQGGSGVDTLRIPAEIISLDAVLKGLSVDGSMFLVRHVGDNRISFTDRDGNPATISGTLTLFGKTLQFSGIEAITVD